MAEITEQEMRDAILNAQSDAILGFAAAAVECEFASNPLFMVLAIGTAKQLRDKCSTIVNDSARGE